MRRRALCCGHARGARVTVQLSQRSVPCAAAQAAGRLADHLAPHGRVTRRGETGCATAECARAMRSGHCPSLVAANQRLQCEEGAPRGRVPRDSLRRLPEWGRPPPRRCAFRWGLEPSATCAPSAAEGYPARASPRCRLVALEGWCRALVAACVPSSSLRLQELLSGRRPPLPAAAARGRCSWSRATAALSREAPPGQHSNGGAARGQVRRRGCGTRPWPWRGGSPAHAAAPATTRVEAAAQGEGNE